jgi:polyhydroxybutyrate depolymerase
VSGIISARAIVHVGGRDRTLVLVRPDDAAPPPLNWRGRALIIVLHGSNQTGESVRTFSANGFDRLAESGAAVIAYPDGVSKHWNDARRSIDFATRKQGVDDVEFLATLVERLAQTDGIDRTRVYLVGFSNGAAMTIRMVLQRPELLAGAAIIAATLPAPENLLPIEAAAIPLPVVLFHGTKDPLVPYAGGMASLWGLKPRGIGLSAEATAAFFAERNGISAEPTRELLPPVTESEPTVELTDYRQSGLPEVRLYTVHGGGHVIPSPHRAPVIMGHSTRELVAADVIAEFFGLTPG